MKPDNILSHFNVPRNSPEKRVYIQYVLIFRTEIMSEKSEAQD